MASDLIRKKALLEAMEKKYDIAEKTGLNAVGLDCGFIITDKIIREQSTVDAVEVVHGEWIGMIPEDFACAEGFGTGMTEEQKIKYLEDFYHRTHCSVCNCCFDDRETKNWNYCPDCGAKMEGGMKDEMDSVQ